ncbi:hypothetical protein [Nitrosomonas communis]|uniref:Transposase n=1 Tax=Nitrosomonas communis TaxID=44574 RepID=A0A1H2ZRM3_9PROT|nr:hypothetical protein [Nitrosomonas communis]SDX20202.1 hypothetical protein SAMN05421882_10903 [Nitrosomonas communis]
MARPLRIEFAGALYHVTVRGNAREDVYLLELARYIALNPVRAQMVRSAKAWRWSCYRATAGYEKNNACLTTEWIVVGFDKIKRVAQQHYRAFVKAGKEQPSPLAMVEEPDLFG